MLEARTGIREHNENEVCLLIVKNDHMTLRTKFIGNQPKTGSLATSRSLGCSSLVEAQRNNLLPTFEINFTKNPISFLLNIGRNKFREDTGAAVLLISKSMYDTLFTRPKLCKNDTPSH